MPALGTAPDAGFWVALEQSGPWGAKAFTQSGLDPELGARLEAMVAAAGGRLLLVRDPLDHDARPGPRRLLVGGGPVAQPWLGATTVEQPEDLVALLETALDPSAGSDSLVGARLPDWLLPCLPVLLVCSNGKRDTCCAVNGGRLARTMATRRPGRVWECTHLGGHRFATTALVLPSRQVMARVDEELAEQALDGRLLVLGPQQDRGRSDLPQHARVVDAWLRDRDGTTAPDAWRLYENGDVVEVRHADGRTEMLRATSQPLGIELPESCGKPAVPAASWQVESLR